MSQVPIKTVLEVTLVADGSSDRVLVPIIESVFDVYCRDRPFVVRFADGVHHGPLVERLVQAMQLFPCDILLVHRDAEGEALVVREAEIANAVQQAGATIQRVNVVPVRMTESWLLLDAAAIRSASGNPHGQVALDLPTAATVEKVVGAKDALFVALETASELSARRRRRFDRNQARQRVAQLLDFKLLRTLSSFRHFEKQVTDLFDPRA